MSKFEPILRIKDLSTHFFTYAGEIKALDAINLKIDREKESLGLVGETGCGKSVTALSIMQLIPQPPGKIIQGEIWFNGENLLTKSERYMQREVRGKNISMIFQEPMTSLNPVIRIADQIMEAILLHPDTKEDGDGEVRDRAIELLDLTGIPDPEEVATRYPHQLSGGMRQRVMISMALACNPNPSPNIGSNQQNKG
jgi:ABC-type dipeptide/oligopeptide/nickel transport system ATPase component